MMMRAAAVRQSLCAISAGFDEGEYFYSILSSPVDGGLRSGLNRHISTRTTE
jgi:hypothetical protein